MVVEEVSYSNYRAGERRRGEGKGGEGRLKRFHRVLWHLLEAGEEEGLLANNPFLSFLALAKEGRIVYSYNEIPSSLSSSQFLLRRQPPRRVKIAIAPIPPIIMQAGD